jgi:hypothetical protein
MTPAHLGRNNLKQPPPGVEFMKHLAIVSLALFVAAPFGLTHAQDMDAMAKWANAKVIHYHVVGDFSGSTKVLKGKGRDVSGKVTDHVEIDFDWDQMQQKIAGDPVIKNSPTKVDSMESLEGCPASKLEGPYEYFTFQSVSAMAVMFEMRGRRDLPAGSLPGVKNENDQHAKCGEIWLAIPASTEPVTARMQLGLGMMLAMPAAPGLEMEITPDHKSFIQRINTDGWVWKMTPTIVK